MGIIALSTLKAFWEKSPNYSDAKEATMASYRHTVKDLIPMIGQANRVYEILNGKRQLTLPMIKLLQKELGIPADSLIAG